MTSSGLLIKKPQLINSVCLHAPEKWVGPLRVLSWWPRHARCLFSPFITAALGAPPRPPQLLHLFQLARVRGGAQRSITQAHSCRCTYIARSWQTRITLCLLGGYTGTGEYEAVAAIRELPRVLVGCQGHQRQSEQRYRHKHALSTHPHLLTSSSPYVPNSLSHRLDFPPASVLCI